MRELAKEVQVHMWVSYLERLIDIAAAGARACCEIRTRRLEDPSSAAGPWPSSERERRELEQVPSAPLNFDPDGDGPFDEQHGWEIDRYRQPLPPEAPGEPEADGSWEAARRLMSDYRFADPTMIVADL